ILNFTFLFIHFYIRVKRSIATKHHIFCSLISHFFMCLGLELDDGVQITLVDLILFLRYIFNLFFTLSSCPQRIIVLFWNRLSVRMSVINVSLDVEKEVWDIYIFYKGTCHGSRDIMRTLEGQTN
ncbi:hypothetical protein ACJX0J_021135, partial [Zea mays]